MNDLSGNNLLSIEKKTSHEEISTAESCGRNHSTLGQSILANGQPGAGNNNITNSISYSGIPVNSNGELIPYSSLPIAGEVEGSHARADHSSETVSRSSKSVPDKNKEVEDEDVSEEFVKNFNEHIGPEKKKEEKAKRLIAKMRILGGLNSDPADKEPHINIPAARQGLCILAGLQNNKLKIEALDTLIRLLEKDEVSKESAENLVFLAINLTKKMDRELIQTDTLDVQVKIAKAYGVVAELIQRQYGKKHINAITKELKSQFRNTADNCKALNRLEDIHLAYAVSYALEGIKRIRDDNKELLELLERFMHFSISLSNLYNEDLQGFYQELFSTFKDLNNRHEYAWYNGVLIMNDYAKDAQHNLDKLTGIQILLREKYTDFNWKFIYSAMDILSKIAIHGATPEIRKQAFEGSRKSSHDMPGFLFFKDFNKFARSPDLSPIVHFSKPKLDDDNGLIRMAFIEHLIKISTKSPDILIRFKAKQILIQRLHTENNQGIKDLIQESIPTSAAQQKEWLEEAGKYRYEPLDAANSKKNEIISTPKVEKLSVLAFKAFEKHYKLQKASSKVPEQHKSLPNMHLDLPGKDKLSAPAAPISPPHTPRDHNRLISMLADSLGVEDSFVTKHFLFKGDIRPIGGQGLLITEKGMQQIADLLLANKEISTLNFELCHDDLKGILILAKTLPQTQVRKLTLAAEIDSAEADAIAETLTQKPKLEIIFSNPSGYYRLGKALAKRGLIVESIAFFTNGLEPPFNNDTDSMHVKLLLHRGKSYMLNGSPALAAADFRKVLELDSKDFHAHFELSKAYMDMRRYPQSIDSARNALKIYPEDNKALYQLALSLSRESRNKEYNAEAIKILKELLVKDHDNHDVQKLLKVLERKANKN